MSKSLSLSSSGGGGGGSGGMFFLFLCVELLSTELSFPSVILVVVSSPTSSWSRSISAVNVQLQLFVYSSKNFVSSKAIIHKGGSPSCVG